MSVDAVTLSNILATIRQRESSGNYQSALYGGQGASGAYQYILSTWQAWARKAGYAQYADAPAAAAPKVVQDAVAAYNVQDILSGNGNDISKVPMAWYTGDPNHGPTWDLTKPSDLAGYRANHGYQPGQYVKDWLNTYNQIAAADGGQQATYTGHYTGGVPNPVDPGQVAGATGSLIGGLFGGVASDTAKAIAPIVMAGLVVLGGVALIVAGGWRAVGPSVKPKVEDAAKAGAAVAAA